MSLESHDANMEERSAREARRKAKRVQSFADRRPSRLSPSEENTFKEFIRAHQWENSARLEQGEKKSHWWLLSGANNPKSPKRGAGATEGWFGGPNGI